MTDTNVVQQYVQINTCKWKKVGLPEAVSIFPLIHSENDIIRWNIGSYALTLSEQYDNTMKYLSICIHKKENITIMRLKGFKSRFTSKMHIVYCKVSDCRTLNSLRCYCTCKSGARTLGGCSHAVATMIMMMKLQRSIVTVKRPCVADQLGVEDVRPFKRRRLESARRR